MDLAVASGYRTGCAVRGPPPLPRPRFYAARRPLFGPRHWGQHGGLFHCQCAAASTAAGRRVRTADSNQSGPGTGPVTARLRDIGSGTHSLRAVAATLSMESDLAIDGQSQFIAVEVVSAHYAEVFGVRPSIGRWFVNDREAVAVISDAIWERYFDRRPDVLGRVIQSGTDLYTIVGLAPLHLQEYVHRYEPISMGAHRNQVSVYDRRGGSTAFANADVLAISALAPRRRAQRRNSTARHSDARPRRIAAEATAPLVADAVGTLPPAGSRRLAQTLSTLMAAIAAVVLIIACVNVGHLLLARSALRHREFAIRRARCLASPAPQATARARATEALVLAVAGTLCGLLLAVWIGISWTLGTPSCRYFRHSDHSVARRRALVFAAGICVVTTVLCGLVPALRVSRMSRLMTNQGSVGETSRRKPVGLVVQVVMSSSCYSLEPASSGRS